MESTVLGRRDNRLARVTCSDGGWDIAVAIRSCAGGKTPSGARIELSIEGAQELAHVLASLAAEAEATREEWVLEKQVSEVG